MTKVNCVDCGTPVNERTYRCRRCAIKESHAFKKHNTVKPKTDKPETQPPELNPVRANCYCGTPIDHVNAWLNKHPNFCSPKCKPKKR